MSRSARRTIDLEQSWDYIQKGITKLKNNLEGLTEEKLSSEENMMLYTTIYDICTQKTALEPYYFRQFSDKFRESLEEYILSTVLPTLREKHEEFMFFEHYEEVMLRELVKRWANYNIMVKGLYRFFSYVDRPFPRLLLSLPPLKDVGLTCFRELVYKEINGKMRDAVISLIGQEREGKQIDRALLKNVVDIFVEIGNGKIGCYKNDFEAAMLEDTASYYSQKASKWILEHYSRLDYTLKVEKCLKMEKERAAHYLHSSSEPKLLERVRHELLSVHARC